MKAHLLDLVRAADPLQGRNIAREYLQARILGVLQRAGAMVPLAFQGGPASVSYSRSRAIPKISTSPSKVIRHCTICAPT